MLLVQTLASSSGGWNGDDAAAPTTATAAASRRRRSTAAAARHPSCTHHIHVGPYLHGQTRASERKRPEGNLHIIQPQNQNLTKWSSSTRSILPLWKAGISISFCMRFHFFSRGTYPHKKDKGNHPLMHACQDHTKICSLFISHFIGITIYGVFHLYLFLFYFR